MRYFLVMKMLCVVFSNVLSCGVSLKAPGRWSIRGTAGTRPVSPARDASSPLAPRASSQRTTTTSVCPATRSSLPCSVCTARRYCRMRHSLFRPVFISHQLLHGDFTFKWVNAPFTFLFISLSPLVGWHTMTSRGTRTASSAPAASCSCLARGLPREMTLPIVSTASATSMPRNVLPVPPPLVVIALAS